MQLTNTIGCAAKSLMGCCVQTQVQFSKQCLYDFTWLAEMKSWFFETLLIERDTLETVTSCLPTSGLKYVVNYCSLT